MWFYIIYQFGQFSSNLIIKSLTHQLLCACRTEEVELKGDKCQNRYDRFHFVKNKT